MNGADKRPDPMLVQPFPRPGKRVELAYRELSIAAGGTAEQKKVLGDPGRLPKPWIPATCDDPPLRAELWTWFDAVVVWLNHQMVFDPADVIPSCWPRHPHLVHELAVLADLRRRAETAQTPELLEEWNRYALPAFTDRMRHRMGGHCVDEHSKWPARGRFITHLDQPHAESRARDFAGDVNLIRESTEQALPGTSPRLRLVYDETGEVLD